MSTTSLLLAACVAQLPCHCISSRAECKSPESELQLHQVRAFVKNKEGMAKQELNQSPLPFVESAAQPGKFS